MKTTDHFKQVILDHLTRKAETNELFTPKFNNPKKNIDECITYILNSVKDTGCNGFTDEEIYGMAVHYYEEETINVGHPIDCDVVINQQIPLTEEELRQAKEKALQKAQDEAYEAMTKKKHTPTIAPASQASLF